MRIAVFSDIHGNLAAFAAVLADIAAAGADQLVCLGDLALNGPWPGECVAAVRDSGALSVHGNTDLALLRATGRLRDGRPVSPSDQAALAWHGERLSAADLDFMAALPRVRTIAAGDVRLQFMHASAVDVSRAIRPTDSPETLEELTDGARCDWFVLGHTHVACLFRLDGCRVLNTGAVSRSLDGNGRPAYTIIDTETGSVTFRRVGYDVERALATARERGWPLDVAEYERLLRFGSQ